MGVARALAGLAMFALGTGCPWQNATVSVPAAGKVASDYRVWGAPAVLLTTPFVDARPDRSRCGVRKAGSSESASVTCSAPPAQWLAELVAQQLRAAGFLVFENEAPPGGPVIRIEGFLSQLFIEPDVQAWPGGGRYVPEADIAVTLVARGRQFEAERRFYFKGLGDWNGGGLESNFQFALDNSVRDTLNGLVSAITEVVTLAPRFDAYACSSTRK